MSKERECTCSGFVLQYEGSCQCGFYPKPEAITEEHLADAYARGEQCGYDRGFDEGDTLGYMKGYEEAMEQAVCLTEELIERLV